MENQITYIFGAGASSQSMPLNANFVERFELFIFFIRDLESSKKKELFLSQCEEFLKSVRSHLSFDTFFKKLFHNDNDMQIKTYKKIILVYFIFEHFIKFPNNIEASKMISAAGKKFNIDPRYDALIAGLLKPLKQPVFFNKVNFITWNYDLNLMTALRNFLFPNGSLQAIFRNMTLGHNKGFSLSDDSKLIHLNGIIYHPNIDGADQIDYERLRTFLGEVIEKEFFGDSMNAHANHISFAWETYENDKTKIQAEFLQQAMGYVHNSMNIVIIGYSFPLYNRLIDLFYLNEATLLNKNIYIQDPDADNLVITFREGFMSKRYYSHCQPIKEIRSFYVPKDVFI
jgi:hypothetical protein